MIVGSDGFWWTGFSTINVANEIKVGQNWGDLFLPWEIIGGVKFDID